MKRKTKLLFFVLFLAAVSMLSSCSYEVHSVRSHSRMAAAGGVVYALPQTELCVDFTLGHYNVQGARYAQFAEEMLGSAVSAKYQVTGVNITSRVRPDSRHVYMVRPKGTAVQVDGRGILRSVGIGVADEEEWEQTGMADLSETRPIEARYDYNLFDRVDTFYTRFDHPGHPSMIASKKDSRSLRQQAQEAAERIGELQERRQQLLGGDITGYTPEGIQLMLQLIDRQEGELMEQFVGRYEESTVSYVYVPKDDRASVDSQSVVLCYFSPSRGMVQNGGGDAVAISCNIVCPHSVSKAAKGVKVRLGLFGKADMNDRDTFKYRRSEVADVQLVCPLFDLQRQVPIAQFGNIMELPKGEYKAIFDPRTGDLVYLGN